MTCRLHLLLLAAAFGACSPAAAADRNYSVTGFDQIRVNGPYKVRLVTGVAPFARASGSVQALDGVAIDVSGQILTVRRNSSASSGYPGQPAGPVEIEIGTHNLRSAALVGAGSLDIDAVRGMSFSLTVEGAGAAKVGNLQVDQLKLWAAGTASASLGGSAKTATFLVRGVSSLDVASLSVKDAVIGSEGPAMVRANVSNSAKVDAKGVSQITLDGEPACTVTAAGSATVSGCR
ncbi:MAG TPA: DUF2807 domain-containing protein [Sphingomicrobium sp.]